MAQYYGSNATLRDNSVPSKKIAAQDAGGRLRCAYDEFSLPSALALGDLINLGKVPSGARIHDVTLDCDALTAGAVNVGWLANGVDNASANGFMAAQSVAAAARVSLAAGAAGAWKVFGADTQLQIAVSTAITATSGKIRLSVRYSLD